MKVRILLYSLFLTLLYMLAYIITPLRFNGVSPSYLLCAVVALGLFENEYFGAIYGLVFGLISDLVGSGVFGFNALLFAAVGYTVGYLAENRIRSNLLACELICVLCVFCRDTALALWNRIFYGADFFPALLKTVLPSVLLTAVVAVVIYFAVKLIGTNRKWRKYNEKIR